MTEELDYEVKSLVEALNMYEGIETISSCCGHDERPFRIWFSAEQIEHLAPVVYVFDSCHCGFRDWFVEVITDCSMNRAIFMIEGPIGAYAQADKIAQYLREHK